MQLISLLERPLLLPRVSPSLSSPSELENRMWLELESTFKRARGCGSQIDFSLIDFADDCTVDSTWIAPGGKSLMNTDAILTDLDESGELEPTPPPPELSLSSPSAPPIPGSSSRRPTSNDITDSADTSTNPLTSTHSLPKALPRKIRHLSRHLLRFSLGILNWREALNSILQMSPFFEHSLSARMPHFRSKNHLPLSFDVVPSFLLSSHQSLDHLVHLINHTLPIVVVDHVKTTDSATSPLQPLRR
ncbi:hypothetical protein JCM5353_005626 [Sporobolomyces roseus]